MGANKIEEPISLAAARTEMDIGEKEGAELSCAAGTSHDYPIPPLIVMPHHA
jgi:hypothetical protein